MPGLYKGASNPQNNQERNFQGCAGNAEYQPLQRERRKKKKKKKPLQVTECDLGRVRRLSKTQTCWFQHTTEISSLLWR